MTAVVCEVGPATMRMSGSSPAQPDSSAAALLDTGTDTLAVVDDTVLPVVHLWRRTLGPLLTGHAAVRLIHPSWWPPQRVAHLVEAAADLVDSVETVTRMQALARDDATVVEIAAHLVVVGHGGEPRTAVARPVVGAGDVTELVVRAILETAHPCVHLDAPRGVPGAEVLAADIARRLHGTRAVTHARLPSPPTPPREIRQPRSIPRPGALLAAALVGAVALIAWLPAPRHPTSAPTSVRALLEGRVTTAIPDGWEITRVRSGPGSARVEVAAPDGVVALHVTQAPVPGRTLLDVAADLRTALDDQPPGVFTDFHPHDEYAGRPVVSYTERRGDRDIRWLVFVDGATRIGIGCQSPAGAPEEVRPACDDAVRAAREIT